MTRVALVAAAFAVLGWILANTAPNEIQQTHRPPAAPEPNSITQVELVLESPIAPNSLEVLYLGKQIAASQGQISFSTREEIALNPHGADLVVRATWPDPSPQALRIQTRIEGRRHSDQTLWGNGEIEEAVSIPPAP